MSSKIIKVLDGIQVLYKANGCSDEQIADAEARLKLHFSEEYRLYLKTYGAVSFGSAEWTGLGVDPYLDVVEVTLAERNNSEALPHDCIVLENTGSDGLLVLHHTKGSVLSWDPSGRSRIYADSLSEYAKIRSSM